MTSAVLRIGKIKGLDHLSKAVRHNLRTIPVAGVDLEDPAASAPIEIISGDADPAAVRARVQALLRRANIARPRRDAVLAIEFIVSLSDWQLDAEQAFFAYAASWLSNRFGGPEHLLSSVIHRDESKPHMHVLQVPLINGRLVGSDAIGGPAQLCDHLAAFQRDVCVGHGLTPVPSKAGPVLKHRAWRAVLNALRASEDPILRSALWQEVQPALRHNPVGAAAVLGIDLTALMPVKRMRSSTAIFTSKGKGARMEAS